MSKMTFKEFLMEADLQIQQKQAMGGEEFAARGEGKAGFQQQQRAQSPSQGDVIEHNKKYFIITKMSVDGIHVKQAGGKQEILVPHGTKFKNIGATEGGKAKFAIVQ